MSYKEAPILLFRNKMLRESLTYFMLFIHVQKTSIECLNQGASSQRYLNMTVTPQRSEPVPGQQEMNTLTYPQYLATVRTQVSFAKELHDMLLAAAQNVTSAE